MSWIGILVRWHRWYYCSGLLKSSTEKIFSCASPTEPAMISGHRKGLSRIRALPTATRSPR